jgi:bifunctional UDP-N-acetylglucosamine pyrophosphorylase/glucosamine-1-phosphate N-acetyltransferase
MKCNIVILAAGQGSRMQSALPKVIHCLSGTPLLQHVLNTVAALELTARPIVIVGHEHNQVQTAISMPNINWIMQREQLGTAHALQQALPACDENLPILILYGDVPLISAETLQAFLAQWSQNQVGLITANVAKPLGLGRIIRNKDNHIESIVEEKDATTEEKRITEINSGIYLFPYAFTAENLPRISNSNAQSEYYLTDLIALAKTQKLNIFSQQPFATEEILGVNDRLQLAKLERYHQKKTCESFMKAGVTFYDPARFDARGNIQIGKDTIIDINVILEGNVTIGESCFIGAHTHIKNSTIQNGVNIKSHCVIEGAIIADTCTIGPYARLRPGTQLWQGVQIGNFVEIKNSVIGSATKINHLSYIGDCQMGAKVNIGAGTITCNYDGANKHSTLIGDHAFIGSNSQLIAPISIGEYATIGAGSTIRKDAPAHQLTLCRSDQRSYPSWQRPIKKLIDKNTQ